MPEPAIEPKLLGELAVVIIKAVSPPKPASRMNLLIRAIATTGSHSPRLSTLLLATGREAIVEKPAGPEQDREA